MGELFEGHEHAVRRAVPLAALTSFKIGGPAEYLVEPRSVEELAVLVRRCVRRGVPVRVLGGGSNILVSDRGVAGAVFRLSKLREIVPTGNVVRCGAGVRLTRLLRKAEQWGLSGLEPLAGIPGTIGGAVAMNAGGTHGCIASLLRAATTMDRRGRLHERAPAELGLGYRQSRLHGQVVVQATFELSPARTDAVVERRQVILRDKARSQPLSEYSAGCVFRNPAGDGAGRLIDLAGLKGERVGHALVSTKHANFIINEGGATARDVAALIGKVHRQVQKRFGIDLELEIELWN